MDPEPSPHYDHDQQQIDNNLNRKISELSDLHLKYTYSNASNNSEFSLYEQPSNVQQFQHTFVKDDDLFTDIADKLEEVKSMLFLDSKDICLYLYYYYEWNLQKMTSFFEENWGDFRKRAEQFDPEKEVKNAKKEMCGVCLQETEVLSSGMCDHKYCKKCWLSYIQSELLAGRVFFGCMNQKSCAKAPVLKGFVEALKPELQILYRRKVLMNYSLRSKDLCYCPQQKCPYFCSKPTMMELTIVSCPCGELYCFKCLQEPHNPATCKDVHKWNQMLNSSEVNSSWIKNHTRQCPKCRQPIEKKVGCSHMKCICQCQFCYECGNAWDQQHKELKTECPKRKQLGKKCKVKHEVVEMNEELNKMMVQAEKHQNQLMLCMTVVKEQNLLTKIKQIKKEVVCGWLSIKWTKILLTLQQKAQIDAYLQEQFIKSIRGTMQPVEHIIRQHNAMTLRDIQLYGQRVLVQKQVLRKHKNVWAQAFDIKWNSF